MALDKHLKVQTQPKTNENFIIKGRLPPFGIDFTALKGGSGRIYRRANSDDLV